MGSERGAKFKTRRAIKGAAYMRQKEKKKCTAIVLAAGQGTRMGSKIQKQFLEIEGKPILYYTLKAFETSCVIDDVVLVVGSGMEQYCRQEIVEKYGFKKINQIAIGGKERYESVFQGLRSLEEQKPDYVFVHDGARPFVDENMLERAYDQVVESKACVAGMPAKDTIKIVDSEGRVITTPERKSLWQVQTPQVFAYGLIRDAYSTFMNQEQRKNVTDDAMVLELFGNVSVRMFEGSYENIKITTPEDLSVAEIFVKKRKKD